MLLDTAAVLMAITYIRNAIHIVVSELFAEKVASSQKPGKRCLVVGSGTTRVQIAEFHSALSCPSRRREGDRYT